MSPTKLKDRGRKWDGKSRVSNDLYRKNFNDIFKKTEDPFKKPVVEDKVKVKDLKKLLKDIGDRNGF